MKKTYTIILLHSSRWRQLDFWTQTVVIVSHQTRKCFKWKRSP